MLPDANIFKSKLFPSCVQPSSHGELGLIVGGNGLTVTEKVSFIPLFAVHTTSVVPIGKIVPEIGSQVTDIEPPSWVADTE